MKTIIRSICVYCGSSPGTDPAFVEAGHKLGEDLAASGIALVYGGGTNGVMGAVARGALGAGGHVAAIIPKFLINRETTADAAEMFDDLTIVDTMHERKHAMFDRSDAFVALPGGLGTVEEIVEIMTWAQLGQHKKPIVFANINGFWDPMLALLDHIERAGFLHSRQLIRPLVIGSATDIISAVTAAAPDAPDSGDDQVIQKL